MLSQCKIDRYHTIFKAESFYALEILLLHIEKNANKHYLSLFSYSSPKDELLFNAIHFCVLSLACSQKKCGKNSMDSIKGITQRLLDSFHLDENFTPLILSMFENYGFTFGIKIKDMYTFDITLPVISLVYYEKQKKTDMIS